MYAANKNGDVAQMVERSLSMREVRGSIPRISTFSSFFQLVELFYEWGTQILHDYTSLCICKCDARPWRSAISSGSVTFKMEEYH